jgi:hypothetical protein
VNRDDVEYIMDAFPILERQDQRQFGEYRTKRTILNVYDDMTSTMNSDRPYETRLNPPPADPRAAHLSRRAGQEAAS